MKYTGLSGYTLAGGISERDPGRLNQPIIPPEGFPSTLLRGLNQRMPPVTPPNSYPSTLTAGSGGHEEFPVSSIIPRGMLAGLAGAVEGMQRNFKRISLPIIPREGFPSTLLAGLNQRMAPVTPPESYPSTLGALDLFGSAVQDATRFDTARLAALLLGYLTYKNLTIPQAFLASMAAPWLVRPALGQDIQPGTKLFDGLEAVLAGLLAIGGGGYL
jgi:hypothetical protein